MSEVVEDHINPVDAFTIALERDPVMRATIVAVATFDSLPDWNILSDRVDRATRIVPRFREKLVRVPFDLAPPRWVLDPNFDITLHLRRAAVHSGAGWDAVLEHARLAGSTAFDPERPLWEFTLLEGLPEGRSALLMKIHHALTDGIGGVEIAAHVVDLEPGPVDQGPMPPAPSPRSHNLADSIVDAVSFQSRRVVGAGVELGRSALRNAAHLGRDPLGALRGGAETSSAVARFVRPVTTTLSPVMAGRHLHRNHEVLDVPLSELLAAAHAVDGSLNDAFLAGIGGGLRRYHDHHGAIIDRLRLSMPISVRSAGDGPGGNKVTIERFELPVGDADPAERMRISREVVGAIRRDPAIPYSSTVASALNLLPAGVTAGMIKNVDFLASNVPGFDAPVWVGGAQLESFHPFGPTLGSAANITLMSYRDTCHIGLTLDAAAVPDVEVFRACMEEGFDEVRSVARPTSSVASAKRPKAARSRGKAAARR